MTNETTNNEHTHRFIDPCGSDEGRDSCWFCGRPRAEHPLELKC